MWSNLGNLEKCMASQRVHENNYHNMVSIGILAFDITINTISIIILIFLLSFWIDFHLRSLAPLPNLPKHVV